MRWTLTHGDILNTPADVLVCSANVYLNLSGGVGGEILRRFGDAMQKALHRHLSDHNLRHVPRGTVVPTPSCGTWFTTVFHAVAVDGFYQSSPQAVRDVTAASLRLAAAGGARTVALAALATGYGRLSMQQFAEAVRPLTESEFPPVSEVVVCVRHASERDDLLAALPRAAAR